VKQMERRIIDGLTLMGIGLTAAGILATEPAVWGKWLLIIVTILLTGMGLYELFISK
jgi:hypothetical protein